MYKVLKVVAYCELVRACSAFKKRIEALNTVTI